MILVCAATRTEAGACAGAPEVEVLRTGVGAARAAAALARRLSLGARPSLVVSSGFAGAVSGPLPLHACVTADALFRLEEGRAVPVRLAPGALRAAPGAARCALFSAGAVTGADAAVNCSGFALAPSAGEACLLRRPAAPCAVDMESAALAEVASAAGLPFAVLRVVTDTAAAPFPPFVADLAAALAAGPRLARVGAAARAAGAAVRAPVAALAFVRSSLLARRALARAWRTGAAGLLEPPHRASPEWPSPDGSC